MKERLTIRIYSVADVTQPDLIEYCADIISRTLSPDEMDDLAEKFDTLSRPESYLDETNESLVNIFSVYSDSRADLKEQIINALSDDYYLTFED